MDNYPPSHFTTPPTAHGYRLPTQVPQGQPPYGNRCRLQQQGEHIPVRMDKQFLQGLRHERRVAGSQRVASWKTEHQYFQLPNLAHLAAAEKEKKAVMAYEARQEELRAILFEDEAEKDWRNGAYNSPTIQSQDCADSCFMSQLISDTGRSSGGYRQGSQPSQEESLHWFSAVAQPPPPIADFPTSHEITLLQQQQVNLQDVDMEF